ncbi:MAG TPA: YciI family protein [Pyrinomonadaceae bacterium]|nr:YciI family protein [Pyrinomonadaceae bacterium]
MRFRLILAITFVLCVSSTPFAQPKEEHKLVQFQMAILKKGPAWDSTKVEDRNSILQQHLKNVLALLNSGKVIIAGPFNDSSDLAGLFIFRTSADEAKALVDTDPGVKAGLMVAEMHPWWSEDIFKKAATEPLKMEAVYFGFLKKGPNRKEGDGDTPEIKKLQDDHIANIVRLANMKKMVMAGPFGDDGELRGIFVFRVASMKEAQDLAATDPMIKIDRLRIDLHPWHVPVGVIP